LTSTGYLNFWQKFCALIFSLSFSSLFDFVDHQ
jgi:hypothetical protein